MTRTVDALVSQVIEYDDLDGYMIPPEIRGHVAPDEDLVTVHTEPHSETVRRVLNFAPIDIVVRLVMTFLQWVPGLGPWLVDLLDTGPEHFVVEHGTVDVGEWVTVDLEEAVFEETVSRTGLEDRNVWLYEGTVRNRGDRS